MEDNYAAIVKANLIQLYDHLPGTLALALGAKQDDKSFVFRAFGKDCRITPEGIYLDGDRQTGVVGILISLYALNAGTDRMITAPFKAYKEFPDTMPYAGAFATHTEQILVPVVEKIKAGQACILSRLDGGRAPEEIGGDFTFVVKPLPKMSLCYIFYEADEEFPASVTCLYSCNACDFLPVDGLADVGEYTSKTILDILHQNGAPG